MWWEMVGWLSSKAAVKSQMQTGRLERLRTPTIWSRVGSASAFSTSTDASTLAGGTVIDGGQQTPLTRSTRSTRSGSVAFIIDSLPVPLTVVYGFARIPSTTINSLKGVTMDTIRESVRARYAETATRLSQSGRCCDADCCGGSDAVSGPIGEEAYSQTEVADLGLSLGASLGCGNPTMLAQLHPGEVVLDLGSGAGLDVLLSARRVSPGGHAYGVDMTDEMLALANENKARAAVANATFLKGTIEAIPLPPASVDVVISNCVINLAPDKRAVLSEAFRVLKPGGRFAVSDMVEVEPLPAHVKSAMDAWAGCVAGTIPIDAYRAAVVEAGFTAVEIEITNIFGPGEAGLPPGSGKIASAFIRALKP